jgi:hypothetical protein
MIEQVTHRDAAMWAGGAVSALLGFVISVGAV